MLTVSIKERGEANDINLYDVRREVDREIKTSK